MHQHKNNEKKMSASSLRNEGVSSFPRHLLSLTPPSVSLAHSYLIAGRGLIRALGVQLSEKMGAV